MMMKLYKFRSLGTCEDLNRAQEILKTGQFWCSRFWDLNDPMEGVYRFYAGTRTPESIRELFNEKSSHALCSFSGKKAFEKPIMWGYYANGFKGIAIEIEVDRKEPKISKINYEDTIAHITQDVATDEAVQRIMTTKLRCWLHENERRYLYKGNDGLQKIGKITAVYFGNPYKTTVNAVVVQQRLRVREYLCRVGSLEQTALDMGITCQHVDVVDGRVQVAESGTKDVSQP